MVHSNAPFIDHLRSYYQRAAWQGKTNKEEGQGEEMDQKLRLMSSVSLFPLQSVSKTNKRKGRKGQVYDRLDVCLGLMIVSKLSDVSV